MPASLLFGAFDLMKATSSPQQPWTTTFHADGSSRGNPDPIEVTVESWLRDGAIVVTQGHTNRELPVRLTITGDDYAGLAAAEAALFGEVGKPNALIWTPPTALAKAAVFVVVTSSLKQVDDTPEADLREKKTKPQAVYGLRLVCEAFVRSKDEVTVAALTTSGTTTNSVDACAAATGWTATTQIGTAPPVSATVTVTAGPPSTISASLAERTDVRVTLEKSFGLTTTTLKYLVVDWRSGSATPMSNLRAYGDGVELPLISETASPVAGFRRTVFYVAAASLNVTKLECQTGDAYYGPNVPTRALFVDQVSISNIKPGFGLGFQLMRSIDLLGSARTSVALAVEHATTDLGDTLVYVWSDPPEGQLGRGYSPPLRQFRVSGNDVTDTSMWSGARNQIDLVPLVFDVPVAMLQAGAHLFMARAYAPATTTVTWTAWTRLAGNAIGPSVTGTWKPPLGYSNIPVARIQLPLIDVDEASSAVLRISVTAAGPAIFDEGWLFNTTVGQLIQVTGASRRLFYEPPTITRPRPVLRTGISADRTDSYYPASVESFQLPQMRPPRVNVFTACAAADASVSGRYFPRHFGRPTV